MPENYIKLMLDSGAFAVWRQGDCVDINAYIAYVLSNERLLEAYANLDVMPGQPGAMRTPAQTEAAASQGWENYLQMREAGLEPIHVFHMGERWYWLEKMLDEGCSYIGLSSNITLPTVQKKAWLDECFGVLCGGRGYPEVKVHGFGITAVSLMLNYPWSTTDSMSWLKQGVVGRLYIPKLAPKGSATKYDYDRSPMDIAISRAGKRGPSQAALDYCRHIHSVGRNVRAYVAEYIEENGMTIEELEADYQQRIRLNSRFFLKASELHNPAPFYQQGHGLFSTSSNRGSTKPQDKFRIILSVGTYLEYANILREEGHPWQLLSYHRLQTEPVYDLRHYVKTGWMRREGESRAGRVTLNPSL